MEPFINDFQEYKSHSLECIAILETINKIIKSFKNLKDSLEFIAFHSRITNKLTTSDGESVAIYEILPNNVNSVFHIDPNISKKSLQDIEEYYYLISQNKPNAKKITDIVDEMIQKTRVENKEYYHIDYIRHDDDMIISKSYKGCSKKHKCKRREIFMIKDYDNHKLLFTIGFFIPIEKCITANINLDNILHLFESELEDKLILKSGEIITVKKSYYENGKLKSKMKFQDNVLHGKSVIYYSNGTIKKKVNYCKGKKNGISLEFYENGQVKSEVMYIMGSPQGKMTKWYENGQVAYEQVYANHKIEEKTKAFNIDGSLMYEI